MIKSVFLLVVLVVNSLATATPGYEARSLGTLGGSESFAWDLNDNGTVVGGSFNTSGELRAFRWSMSTGMVDLGLPSGNARAINNQSSIVLNNNVGNPRAFVTDQSGALTQLPDLSGASWRWSEPNDINDLGISVGWSRSSDSTQMKAVVWKDGQVQQLTNNQPSQGMAINDLGVAVGYLTGGAGKPFVWDLNGGLTLLNADIGGQATSINSNGDVAGAFQAFGSTSLRAALWSGTSHARLDLGLFGGTSSEAVSVNDEGYTLVRAYGPSGVKSFLRNPIGEAMELAPLVGHVEAMGYRLSSSGSVAGISRDASGRLTATLWEPVPEPSSLCMLAGLTLLALKRRQR